MFIPVGTLTGILFLPRRGWQVAGGSLRIPTGSQPWGKQSLALAPSPPTDMPSLRASTPHPQSQEVAVAQCLPPFEGVKSGEAWNVHVAQKAGLPIVPTRKTKENKPLSEPLFPWATRGGEIQGYTSTWGHF